MDKLEKRFSELKDAIINKLREKGGDPNQRIQQMGFETVRIVSDEHEGGVSALLLHIDGSWSIKNAMGGFRLTHGPLDPLLLEYLAIRGDFHDGVKRSHVLKGLVQSMEKVLATLG